VPTAVQGIDSIVKSNQSNRHSTKKNTDFDFPVPVSFAATAGNS